ncbi:exonuclease domain-containing protein, partial [Psittacicella hinzii]
MKAAKFRSNPNANKKFESKSGDDAITYIVYDYETYGIDTKSTGITQLAAMKLDSEFKVRSNDIAYNFETEIYPDKIINPFASIKTGFKIRKKIDVDGSVDYELIGRLATSAKLSEKDLAYNWYSYLTANKNTCILGYNNLNFDDKVTSNLFFRNFINPYSWFFTNGNSRMDLYHIVIAYASLCPKALQWHVKEDGKYSFKLEDISRVNRLMHENAHDAMSDVKACVQLLRLLNGKRIDLEEFTAQEQSKLFNINRSPAECFEFLAKFRRKDFVKTFVTSQRNFRFVYFNPGYGSRAYHGAMPVISLDNLVGYSDAKQREVILVNLLANPEDVKEFFSYTPEQLADYFKLSAKYRKVECPLVIVEVNKFPLFAEWKACFQNDRINGEQEQERMQQNIEIINQVDDMYNFGATIRNVMGERFASLSPEGISCQELVKEVEFQDEEQNTQTNEATKLTKSFKLSHYLNNVNNKTIYLPDTLLSENTFLPIRYA